MSGDTEAPPTYYFSGITFNPSFYQSSTSDYLTLSTAKSNFLTYPTAQGTETIASLNSSSINSTTSATNMTIGNNIVSGDLSIGSLQTTGVLNLGVANTRTTTGNGGAINIGTGGSVSAPINIGTGSNSSGSINIGQNGTTTGSTTVNINTSTVGSHPVYIGSSTALTTIMGASTLTGDVKATTGIKTTYIESTLASTDLELAAAQTGGVLYIGTGPRTSASDINIGTGANLANNLYIGHKGNTVSTQVVRINTSTGASVGSTVIGSATSGTNIIGNAGVGGTLTTTGLITANGGLTVAGNIGTTSVPITMNATTYALYTVSTISCRSSGMATFTSFNNGDVNIGTESYSDLYLGVYNSGNAKTTRIRTENVIIGGGSTGTTTINNALSTGVGTLSGSTAYETKAASYTIPSTINRDYYLVVTLAAVTITLPAVKLNQILHIRNASGGSITLTAPSGSIFPTVSGGGSFNSWTAFAVNTAQNLYCDGTNWYGF